MAASPAQPTEMPDGIRTWRIVTTEGDEGFVIGPETTGEIEVVAIGDLDAIRNQERQRIQEALKQPIHDLATHIGRGRVFADNDEPKLARRELDCAAEAMTHLRAALDTLDPSGEEKRCEQPPAGWRCTRKPGHDGPCAAVTTGSGADLKEVAQDAIEGMTAAMFLLAPGSGGYAPEDPRAMAALWNDSLLPILAAARTVGLEANPYLQEIDGSDYSDPSGEQGEEGSDEAEKWRITSDAHCSVLMRAEDVLLSRFDGLDVGDKAEEVQRLLTEFDAWLSFRGEFSEVLTAFREAFGTDTRATPATDTSKEVQGEQEGPTFPLGSAPVVLDDGSESSEEVQGDGR